MARFCLVCCWCFKRFIIPVASSEWISLPFYIKITVERFCIQEKFLVMQNQSKQRAGLFKLIPVGKSFAGPQPLPSEKVIRARNLTMRIEEVSQYNIWVTTKYSLGSFILFLQSGLQRLLIVSEVIKPLPNQKVINKLKCRVPPCDFRRLSRFSVKRTLGCVRNSRIHFRASRPGKGLPSKIDRNSWCSCYITFWACSRSVLVSVAEWNKKRFYSSRMRYWCLRGKSLPFLSGRSSETYCQVLSATEIRASSQEVRSVIANRVYRWVYWKLTANQLLTTGES